MAKEQPDEWILVGQRKNSENITRRWNPIYGSWVGFASSSCARETELRNLLIEDGSSKLIVPWLNHIMAV